MRLFVAVTDSEWFSAHASQSRVDEVNFWRPSPEATFKALEPGELMLFKLHSPDNFISGGGFFTKFLTTPCESGLGRLRRSERREVADGNPRTDCVLSACANRVECIMVAEPFFWPREFWIPSPPDFKLNTVQGKGYDSDAGAGRELWNAVVERLRVFQPTRLEPGTATLAAVESNGFGKPHIALPRLGQGLFRILVTDAYQRQCAITGERTLPVLDAAHIKPYSLIQRHEISNGLLLRSDLHRLFDEGYMTLDPNSRTVVVSNRIRQEFTNGKDYYKLEGQVVTEPIELWARPTIENLEFHAYNVFR